METQTTEVAASSPAAFEPPSDPVLNLEWRKTGELPAAKKEATSKEASTPSAEDASAAGSDESAARTASDSAPGTKQERAKQPTAADRLSEVLADLKRAGLSPAELKTFKREAQAAADPAKAASEQTVKPADGAPTKPKPTDKNADGTDKYPTWEAFDAARDEYFEQFADFKSKAAVAADRQARAAEATDKQLREKIGEAKARYGDQAEAEITEATAAIYGDAKVHPIVKTMLGESDPGVLVGVMYVLGSKPEELASFVELSRTNPGAAIRKVALLEHLVTEELAKGGKAAAAADEGEGTERDESGKFVSQTPPAKKKPAAPPPPEELSTRGSAPPDPIDAAVRNDDFTAFKAEEDRRDMARRRGAA
ncbi:MAG: hypothetical protein V4502_08040 [Pseudomonadota bacterium]